MSLGGLLAGLLLLGVAALGLLASCIALANLPGTAPRPRPVPGLSGFSLVVAALIFWGTGWAGYRILSPTEAEPLSLLSEVGLTVLGGLAAWLFLRILGGAFPPAWGSPDWRWTARAWLGALPGFLGLAWFNAWLVRLFEPVPPVHEQAILAGVQALTGWQLAAVLTAGVVVQPLMEEALFRGYLWRFLAGRRDFGPGRALVFATAAFTLAHDPAVFLPVAWLGFFFGWVCWRTGSVGQAMFAHGLHNGAAVAWALLLAAR